MTTTEALRSLLQRPETRAYGKLEARTQRLSPESLAERSSEELGKIVTRVEIEAAAPKNVPYASKPTSKSRRQIVSELAGLALLPKLESLSISLYEPIYHLKFLEKLKNVQSLELRLDRFDFDLAPVAALPLETLKLQAREPEGGLTFAVSNQPLLCQLHLLHTLTVIGDVLQFGEGHVDLTQFKRLESLTLSHTTIDGESLLQLPKLRELALRSMSVRIRKRTTRKAAEKAPVQSVAFLSKLDGLEALDLSGNEITSRHMGPLRNLKNLRRLDLSHNKAVKSLNYLSGLTRLEALSLTMTSVMNKHLKVFKHFGQLQSLKLGWCPGISATGALRSTPYLEELTLNNTELIDMTGLRALKRLKSLDLSDAISRRKNAGVGELSALIGLEKLSLAHNGLPFADELRKLTALRHLDLRANAIADLTPLVGLTNLERLELDGNPVKDLKPLSGMRSLKTLSVNQYFNKGARTFTDLRPLSVLGKLQELDISRSEVADVKPLAKLKHLQTLKLGYTFVADMSALAGLSRLRTLELWGAPAAHLPENEPTVEGFKEQGAEVGRFQAPVEDGACWRCLKGRFIGSSGGKYGLVCENCGFDGEENEKT